MIRLKVLSVGKTKEDWLNQAITLYEKRFSSELQIEWVLSKDDSQLLESIKKEKHIIALDPLGKMIDSEEFAAFFKDFYEKSHSRPTFIIGGAEGLPTQIKNHYPLISLSRLTFTHQITRLILVEQIYRALQINKGSSYHKS